jgi:hypothetical protein
MLKWITNAYNSTIGRLDDSVASWVKNLVLGLWHYLASIFTPVSRAWHDFTGIIGTLKTLLTSFGETVVARFLDLYGWVNKEGYEVYYYISHPDKLAGLVVDGVVAQVEKDALAMGEKLGKFFLSLIINHVVDFAKTVEDIIDAIL